MRIPRRHVGIDPVGDGRDLLHCERRVVREVATTGVGKPGRHAPGADFIANLLCGGLRLFVSQERTWGNLAWTMGLLAVLLEYGKDVALEGGRRLRGETGARSAPRYYSQNKSRSNQAGKPHRFAASSLVRPVGMHQADGVLGADSHALLQCSGADGVE